MKLNLGSSLVIDFPRLRHEPMRNETPITNIMVPDPITVDISQGLNDVRRALSSERFHHLPVLDGKKLVGLISVTDLLKLGESAVDGNEYLDRHFSIGDVMQSDVITVSHRATIEEAARMLSAGGFHALPVTDHDEHLRGLLTSTDLINFLLERSPEPNIPAAASDRLTVLEQVLKAAELYLLSGLAETEHTRLELAIAAARREHP